MPHQVQGPRQMNITENSEVTIKSFEKRRQHRINVIYQLHRRIVQGPPDAGKPCIHSTRHRRSPGDITGISCLLAFLGILR